jgi:hypothetical protein
VQSGRSRGSFYVTPHSILHLRESKDLNGTKINSKMEASRASTQDTGTIEDDLSIKGLGSQPESSIDEEMGASDQVSMENESEENPIADCPICYETFSDQLELGCQEDDSLKCQRERLRLDDCGHEFCRECLINHCKHAVSVRGIPICCPAASAAVDCPVVLPERLIEELLCDPSASQYGSMSNTHTHENLETSREWHRYLRFKRLIEDPTLVSCTRCHELMSIHDNRTLDGEENKLICPSCGHDFCSVHGDAHTGMTCDEYKPERRSDSERQIRKSEKIIRKFTKPCSHCGVPIQKESGCDHIVCTSCKDDMCFRCGTHDHLIGEMVRSCKQCEQNFIDHRHIWAYRLTICLSLPLYLPLCLIHIVIMTVLTVASLGCFCCFGCGMRLDSKGEFRLDSKGDPIFQPTKAVQTVFGMIFLPLLDLFQLFGVPCCCGLDEIIPELENTKTADTSLDDDNDIDHDSVDIEA